MQALTLRRLASGRWTAGLAGLAVGLAVGSAAWWGTGPAAAPPDPATPRQVGGGAGESAPEALHSRPRPPEPRCFVGVVLARESVALGFDFDGVVEEVRVRVGDRVEEGEVVARLDQERLRHSLEAARAALRSEESRLAQQTLALEEAEKRAERATALSDLLSRQEREAKAYERERAKADLETARAAVDESRAHIRQVEASLHRTRLRAPFPGVVAHRYVDGGERTVAGAPVVGLIDREALMVRFAVPSGLRDAMQAGTAVRVEVEAAKVRERGTIEHVAPVVDSASRLLFVEAVLDVPPELVAAGSEARVSLLPSAGPPPSPCREW